jgi:hypothetical protein
MHQLPAVYQPGRLSGEILVEALAQVAQAGVIEDKESFLGGTVSLTKYEAYGVEVNLAAIVRKLRQMFKGKE